MEVIGEATDVVTTISFLIEYLAGSYKIETKEMIKWINNVIEKSN